MTENKDNSANLKSAYATAKNWVSDKEEGLDVIFSKNSKSSLPI